jgi:hypothetical protein
LSRLSALIGPLAILADGDTGFYVHDAIGELKLCMELENIFGAGIVTG